MFRKKDFVYDVYFDCYLCSNNQPLLFSTITRDGYRIYKSNPKFCKTCPLLETYTSSANYQKIVTRHIWADLMDELEHQPHTALNKKFTKRENKPLNEYLQMQKKSMVCAGRNIEVLKKSLRTRCLRLLP